MSDLVTKYIQSAPEEQKNLMIAIRALIHKQIPEVIENFKWGRPVFSTNSDFAYFKTTKAYLTFGFFHFNKIKDDTHLLEGTGKDMRHVKFRRAEDLNIDLLHKWIDSISK